MGGKDGDRRSELDKWIDAQREELIQLRDELSGHGDSLRKDINDRMDDASTSMKGPFERFKNFVDSNFTTLSEGFRNLPSNISELKVRMQQEREARQAEEKEIWEAWTGSSDSPDFIRMQIERSTASEREAARDAVFQLLRQSCNKNKDVPAHKILDLYRDNEWKFGGLDKFANPMLSFGGACYYKAETVENLPSTARWGWPASDPQWLSVDWFKRSAYSPVRLESSPDLQGPDLKDPKWRAAFEDLLSVALDKPMETEEKIGMRTPHGRAQSTYYGPGLEWMLSLQCRGILPPQLPSLYKPVSLFDGFDEVKRPRTTPFMHDVSQILESKSATMYPLVKRDLEALIDEVSIKSGPGFDIVPPRIRSWAAADWRVPDTEEELYEQMPPTVAPQPQAGRVKKSPSVDEYYKIMGELQEALDSVDVDEAAAVLSDYFKEYKRVGELVGDVLDKLSEDNELFDHYKVREALRRSDIPEAEQKRVTDGLTSWEHLIEKFGPFSEYDDEYGDDEEEEEGVEIAKAPAKVVPEPTKRPDILAQLTTTQTTRSPDGTVTTKVVLKQRFADGTEEEHETVQTTHEPKPAPEELKAKETQDKKKANQKGGWFWS